MCCVKAKPRLPPARLILLDSPGLCSGVREKAATFLAVYDSMSAARRFQAPLLS